MPNYEYEDPAPGDPAGVVGALARTASALSAENMFLQSVIAQVRADASVSGGAVAWDIFATCYPAPAMETTLAMLLADHAARAVQPFVRAHGRSPVTIASDSLKPMGTLLVNVVSCSTAYHHELYVGLDAFAKLAVGDTLTFNGQDYLLNVVEARDVTASVAATTFDEDGAVDVPANITFATAAGGGFGGGMEVTGLGLPSGTKLKPWLVGLATLQYYLDREPTEGTTSETYSVPKVTTTGEFSHDTGYGVASAHNAFMALLTKGT